MGRPPTGRMHQTALPLPKQLLDGFDKLARQQGVTRGEIMAPASYRSPRRAQGIPKSERRIKPTEPALAWDDDVRDDGICGGVGKDPWRE